MMHERDLLDGTAREDVLLEGARVKVNSHATALATWSPSPRWPGR